MNITRKDVVFIVVFDTFLYFFLLWYINNTIGGSPVHPTKLDMLLYNLLLYVPLAGMPLFFIFSKKDVWEGKKQYR